MKITHKNKMKDLPKMSFILSNSDQDLMEEVRVFDVPKQINKIPVRPFEQVEIGELLRLWDIKNHAELVELTAKVFLRQEIKQKNGSTKIIEFDGKKIPNLPLIDFLRLTLYCEEKYVFAANLFKSLQRKSKDQRIQSILDAHSGSEYDIVARYCDLFPGKYTIHEATKVAWGDVFLAFRRDTIKNDINEEIMEVKK